MGSGWCQKQDGGPGLVWGRAGVWLVCKYVNLLAFDCITIQKIKTWARHLLNRRISCIGESEALLSMHGLKRYKLHVFRNFTLYKSSTIGLFRSPDADLC